MLYAMAEDRKRYKPGTYASQRDRRRRVIAEFRAGLVVGFGGLSEPRLEEALRRLRASGTAARMRRRS